MKKLLALVLALLMLLGCMSITVFAEEPKNVTAITATKTTTEEPEPEVVPVSYEMVIPAAVTITEAGVKKIGTPAVKNVQNAEDNTVISYVATGTQLTLKDSDKTMATTYYKAFTSRANYTLLDSDPIVVYQNKAVVATPTTLYVGVSKSAWDTAEDGTYAATVTFNFSAGGVPCPVSLEREDSNPVLYRVIRKDADKIVYAGYYEKIQEGYESYYTDYDDSAKLHVRYESKMSVQQFGEDCQVGDVFHLGGDSLVKCINPSTHNLDLEIGKGILFSLYGMVTYCRPSGSKCVVTEDDGKLQVIIPGADEPETLAGGTFTDRGKTYKTIWYFNGMDSTDKIASGIQIDIEENDVFYANSEEIDN